MRAVGVRELKNRLSECLRIVADGETVLVTDRGKIVAELRQPTAATTTENPVLLEMAAAGLGGAGRPDLYPDFETVSPPGTAQRLLDADRGER